MELSPRTDYNDRRPQGCAAVATVLISLDGAADVVIDKPIILIGRNDDCDVVLSSKKVSRQHCCIAQVEQRLVIRDLGSTNGIRINGERADEARLKVGDELAIGDRRFKITDHPTARPTPDAPARRHQVSDKDLEDADRPIPLSDSHVPIVRDDPYWPSRSSRSGFRSDRSSTRGRHEELRPPTDHDHVRT